jgi:hypothetical protein
VDVSFVDLPAREDADRRVAASPSLPAARRHRRTVACAALLSTTPVTQP